MRKSIRSYRATFLIGGVVGLTLLLLINIYNPLHNYDNASYVAPPKTTTELLEKAHIIVIGEVGPVIQHRTFSGYDVKGELLDGTDLVGNPSPKLPITDFQIKVDRVIKDDGTITNGRPLILRMAGDATPETKKLTANTDYPFSYTGDRHLFVLSLDPDGKTYGFYYGPYSRLNIDQGILRVSDQNSSELKLDGQDAPIALDSFIQRVAK